ncbi:MAG: secretion system protein [Phormidesmis sp. RL_2_1]|nr:secretion system protein [Phormidesmis sp. RL_2_1]
MVGGALAVLASPLTAVESASGATTVEGIALRQTRSGLVLTLATSGDTPQMVTATAGKVLQADIAHAELSLAEGKRFSQKNPAPGIDSIQLESIGEDRVRLTVNGHERAPMSDIQKSAGDDAVLIKLDTRAIAKARPSKLPDAIATIPGDSQSPASASETSSPQASSERVEPAIELAQAQRTETPDVLVPNPSVVIDGTPISAPSLNTAPPFLPRASAPPVGDFAVSDIDSTLDVIDLGSAERVPRLVLRDASAREVLSLLARAAGLNMAFTNADENGGEGPDVRVSLDIENEPVQNVFNYVLQLSGLEANKVGRTIFVGPRLPNSARNVLVRSIRLNQIDVSSAVNFLVSMGAESAVSKESTTTSVNAVEVGGGTNVSETTTTGAAIENQRADFEDSDPLLRGLQIIGDERTNSLTLIGTPRQIEIATAQMVQLDLRRRQVAVNLRVIDVNLNALDAFGTSFSFGAGNTSILQSGGLGVVNFGNIEPASTRLSPSEVGSGLAPLLGSLPFSFASQFLAQLQAVVTNGQAKIVTDPTLVVQEGQTAAVQLTQEVVTNITIDRETTETGVLTTTSFEKEDAGLNLQVQIDRIDDNGFVNLSVAPSISAPTGTFDVGDSGTAILLSERQLTSGQIRVRDGQTLVLSGIIQESDRVTTSKIPILGDLPLLGALFRSTNRTNDRRELIVLLTPQVMDDADTSVYGYSYTPGEDVQQLLEERQSQ